MATGWVKSLHCKSNALHDVVYNPKPKKPLLPVPSSCSNSSQALRDVVFLFPKYPHLPRRPPEINDDAIPLQQQQAHPKPKIKPKPKPKSKLRPKPAYVPNASPPPAAAAASSSSVGPTSFPTLTELPAGHSSRRVVEIIFGSSWSHRGTPFPGRIEMLFRVHNPTRTVARFEDYRSAVRARADGDARCAADGNEMMRFHCATSASAGGNGVYDASVVCLEGEGVRTFAGSGGAHESAGVGPGRRAMLVCRVIVGRVRAESDPEGSGESVRGAGKGELVVFDPRAVLPCFLIIYKI